MAAVGSVEADVFAETPLVSLPWTLDIPCSTLDIPWLPGVELSGRSRT